jgi:hypothetical protein
VKIGKLTKATTVFRGIAGKAMPQEFWHPNEYGVKGGVEAAFMSTTTDRAVAMNYASGSNATGIVFEIPQGMVNRGANIGWLSQYPHEEEILFGPLSGIEVRQTRVDGSVVVIEAGLSINLNALTLEQVVAKRHKLICDMCGNLQLEIEGLLRGHEWETVAKHCRPKIREDVRAYVEQKLSLVTSKLPETMNNDKVLLKAMQDALDVKDAVLGAEVLTDTEISAMLQNEEAAGAVSAFSLPRAAGRLKSRDPSVRQTALDELGRCGGQAAPWALAIAEGMESPDDRIKRSAIEALGKVTAVSKLDSQSTLSLMQHIYIDLRGSQWFTQAHLDTLSSSLASLTGLNSFTLDLSKCTSLSNVDALGTGLASLTGLNSFTLLLPDGHSATRLDDPKLGVVPGLIALDG